MKRFSLLWWICFCLKFVAIFTVIEAVFNFSRTLTNAGFVINDREALISFPFNIQVTVSITFFNIWAVVSRILNGLAKAGLLWGAAEVIRIVKNTEFYGYATYSVFRKRAEQQRQSTRRSERFTLPTVTAAGDPIMPHQAQPPEYRRRLRRYGEGSGYRDTNTVFVRVGKIHERPENVVRPPRPAGQIEVIQSLDTPDMPNSDLPFDRI